MTANRSLDEFVGGGESADGQEEARLDERRAAPADSAPSEPADQATGADGDPGGSADTDADAGGTTVGDAEPDRPVSTYVRRPEGGSCASCGERVGERWRDGDDLVCVDCKRW